MAQQLMIDIETLSTRDDAAILSIGAVFFDTDDHTFGETFYSNIKQEKITQSGHICPETVAWWMQQSDESRKVLFNDEATPCVLTVLCNLVNYIQRERDTDHLKVWAKSPNFDLTIIKNAFSRNAINCPWKYSNERDVRTAIQLSKDLFNTDLNEMELIGDKHNALDDALDDAMHQASQIIELYQTAEHVNKMKEAA